MRNLTNALCALAVAGAIAAAVLFVLIGNSKQRLQTRLLEAETQVAALNASLTAAQAAQATQAARLHDLDTELGTAKRELTEARLHSDQLRQALELAETEHETAQATIDELRVDLSARLAALQAARTQLAAAVPPAEAVRYRGTIAQLEGRVAELEERLSHQPAAPAFVAGRADHAQVVSVGPQNAFVVINFGTRHGALPNQRLMIKRGPEPLAEVEISDTRENYSVAQVLPDSLSGKLRKGDAATLIP